MIVLVKRLVTFGYVWVTSKAYGSRLLIHFAQFVGVILTQQTEQNLYKILINYYYFSYNEKIRKMNEIPFKKILLRYY